MSESQPAPEGRIRAARGEDRARVLQLAERLGEFAPPPGREREQIVEIDARLLRGFFEQPEAGSHLLVLEEADAVLGFALLSTRSDPIDEARVMHLQALVVAEEAGGRGLGRRLIEACEALARQCGASALSLYAFAGNHRARQLYRTIGFNEDMVSYRKPL